MDALKRKLGRKSKARDSASLNGNQKIAWDLQQLAKLRGHDQPAFSTSRRHTTDKKTAHHQVPLSVPQADWFTAAMQNSAQLADMAAAPLQEKPQDEVKLSSTSQKASAKQRKAKRQVQYDEEEQQKEDSNADWFNQAVQQSSQLSQMTASSG